MGSLTYEEFIELARANYDNGGDGYFECWDRAIFDEYIEMFGSITKERAMSMFEMSKAIEDDRAGW